MKLKFWEKKEKKLRLVIGTKDTEALSAVSKIEVPYQIAAEAVTCDGLYHAVSEGADLVIADLSQLASIEYSPEGVREILGQAGVPLAMPAEFAENPISWQEAALTAKGFIKHLPSRLVAVTSYSGGVGKTTISLDMAARFVKRTDLPTMVMEFVSGVSALRAICDPDAPILYDCITEEIEPAKWRGVAILPMEFTLARTLPERAIADFLARERKAHVLTVVDGHYQHPLLRRVLTEVTPDLWLIIGSTKPDALSNIQKLSGQLNSHQKTVMNMTRGRLDLVGVERDLTLPYVKEPQRYDGKLGNKVLKMIYSTW